MSDEVDNSICHMWNTNRYIKNIKKPWRCDECMFTDSLDECIFLKTDADIDGLNIDCPIVEIADRKTENYSENPNNCETCKHNKLEWYSEVCDGCSKAHSNYEPKDEPQTDVYDYKGNGKWERSE